MAGLGERLTGGGVKTGVRGYAASVSGNRGIAGGEVAEAPAGEVTDVTDSTGAAPAYEPPFPPEMVEWFKRQMADAMGRGGDEIMVRAEKRYGTAVKVVVVASVVAAIAATACAIILAVKK